MHPEISGTPSVDEYVHIVTCDACTAQHGDAQIATWGNALLLAATIANNANWN